jgi:ribulose-5-phosphate 4-epimerase/fuculose-1-phosphate aldolase
MSAVLKPKNSKPVRERVSREEWQMRTDLAAAYQLAAIFKWTDLIYTHFSARLPGSEDFLINPYGLMFDEITASNLVKIDANGKVLDDPLDLGYNEAGFVIHGCVHAARPEIGCVIHTHTRGRGGVGDEVRPAADQPARHARAAAGDLSRLRGHRARHGRAHAHGAGPGQEVQGDDPAQPRLLALGETVREAFEMMYYLDCACQIQIDAVSGGLENVAQMSKRAAATATEQFERPDRPATHKDWPALLRLLERRGIDYRG